MNNILGNNKRNIIWLHIFVWMVLFSFPYILSSGQQQVLIRVIAHSWIPLFMYAIIFYVNYLFWVESQFFKRKFLLFSSVNIALIMCCIWLRDVLNNTFFVDLFPKKIEGDGPPISLFIYVQILSFIIPVFFAIALKLGERYIKNEAEKKEAEKNKLEFELQHLRYQLQPHFFFNSLNNIYSLVDLHPERAKSTLHSLSKLMRYLLYETNTDRISLSKEIQFMNMYIELMKLRLSESTKIESNFPEVTSEIEVAPLLFISLVENAFKHGVSANHSSIIYFDMKVNDNHIKFTTENPNFAKNSTDKSGSGIGLQNLQKRLDLIYPEKHQFIYEIRGDVFVTELTLELN